MIDLILGDCLEKMKAIPDESVDCILCDLPDGTTNNQWDKIIPLDKLWVEYQRINSSGKTYGAYAMENVSTKENFPRDILEFAPEKEKLHPTQKPIALLEYLIKTYTNENYVVLDNFRLNRGCLHKHQQKFYRYRKRPGIFSDSKRAD